MEIGKKIEISRREKNWTQSELAKHSGVDRTTISWYENGKIKKIGLENLTKIALSLGKPLSFFTDSGEGGKQGLDDNFLCQYQHLLKILATMDKAKIEALITLLQ